MSPDRRSFGSGVVLGLVAGAVIAAIAAFVISWLIDDTSDDPVAQARETIQDNYFKETNATELDDASISGMVEDIKRHNDDKFSHYFTADQLKLFEEQTSGRFAGVGLSVTEVPAGLRVSGVFPDTPAADAGLETGDVITAVDGVSFRLDIPALRRRG